MALNTDVLNQKQLAKAAHDYSADNSGSMYCEFADNLSKK
jgi:hypothetical protein